MQFEYLIFYAIAVSIITMRAYIKKYNMIYCALWTLNAISAIFCIICYVFRLTLLGNGAMQAKWYDLSDTSLMAYVLLIVCSIIAFEPIRKFDSNNELANFGKDGKMRNFYVIYSIIYIIFSCIFIIPSLGNIIGVLNNSAYGELRSSLANGENEMSIELATNFISKLCYDLCCQFKYLSIFVAFGALKEKINRALSFILLGFTFFIMYISNAVIAGRGSFVIFAFDTMLILLVFFKYFSKATKRKSIIVGSVLGAAIVSYFLSVTISRVAAVGIGSSFNLVFGNIAFYLGHGPIEFSKIVGSLSDFAYGQTIIGRMLSHYFGTPYSWETIASSIGYPNIGPVYVTYLGYLYTDFGVFSCLLFTIGWAAFLNSIIKKRPCKISTLFIFSYYLHYYVTGVFVIGRLEYVRVVTTIVIYLFIRLIEKSPELRRFFTLKVILRG